jgi:DegV family protein with EDD domain
MANRVALITDSTCDIPTKWVNQYGIQVIPLTIVFGDQQYLDGVELSAEQFYERLPRDPHPPTTSQPAPGLFLKAYQQAAEGGAEEILVITISEAMSGTIESARRASKDSPIPVTILDGKMNSMGLGWQVIAAARVQEAGGDLKEMVAEVERVEKSISYYISLDTMEYLSRGGRIAGAVKFLNSVLHIKPLIYVRPETGTVGASLPARSRKAAIDGLYHEFFQHVDSKCPLHITVLHNDALPEAEALAERVRQEYSPAEIFISIVSPVLGVHTGPKAIALCGYSETKSSNQP